MTAVGERNRLDAERRQEVWGVLYSIRTEEFDPDEFRDLEITGSEIAAYLEENDADDLPALNVELLRDRLTWARKSMEVREPFSAIDWQQHHWLLSELQGEPTKVTVTTDDGSEIEGYVAENFCDTAGCIAGGIAMIHGSPVWQKDEGLGSRNFGATYMSTGETIEDFAGDKLGLTELERRMMFDGDVNIDFLETLAEAVCLRRGLVY